MKQNTPADAYECGRLSAYCDGIFAVATTLTVFEIMPPDLTERILSEGTSAVLFSMYPKLLNVVFTFFMVAIYWLGHHRIFSYIKKADHRFLQINLLFLMLISFMPFAIKISGAHSHDFAAAIVYPGYMAATGLCLHLIWRYASTGHRLIDHSVSSDVIRLNLLRTAVPPCIFLVSIGVAFIAPVWARYAWLLLIANRRITDGLFRLGDR